MDCQAESLQIPLCTLDDVERPIDVAIDGADSVDGSLNLVKGGGGAMHREKLIELAAKKFVVSQKYSCSILLYNFMVLSFRNWQVIVDDSKLCKKIGSHFPLPVEIGQFCHGHIMRQIAALPAAKGCSPVLRRGDCSNNKSEPGAEPAVTDNGNFVVDLQFEGDIEDSAALAAQVCATDTQSSALQVTHLWFAFLVIRALWCGRSWHFCQYGTTGYCGTKGWRYPRCRRRWRASMVVNCFRSGHLVMIRLSKLIDINIDTSADRCHVTACKLVNELGASATSGAARRHTPTARTRTPFTITMS